MANAYPKISIITPSYNQGQFIEKTILSVLNQNYPNLEYIIIDGGSTDNTISVLEKYKSELIWISEPDQGMYDAINKGFRMCTGEILAWINSDDIFYDNALHSIARIFTHNPKAKWVTGRCGYINEHGIKTKTAKKKVYNTQLLRKGFYRTPYSYVINQNVVFWRKTLWDKSGGCDINYKSAGDFELWTKFAKHSDLYFFDYVFSAFRSHSNQKTSNPKDYMRELRTAPKPLGFTILKIILGRQFQGPTIIENEKGEFSIKYINLNPQFLKPGRMIINIFKHIVKKIIKK